MLTVDGDNRYGGRVRDERPYPVYQSFHLSLDDVGPLDSTIIAGVHSRDPDFPPEGHVVIITPGGSSCMTVGSPDPDMLDRIAAAFTSAASKLRDLRMQRALELSKGRLTLNE